MGLFDFFKKKPEKTKQSAEKKSDNFSVGDIFYIQNGKTYNLYKLLAEDKAFDCYHVLSYQPIAGLPEQEYLEQIDIAVYHSPFSKSTFAGATILFNMPILPDDLIGYHEYLRQTQPPEYYVPIANTYYREGLRLSDAQKRMDAINEYSKAIDLFPQFFEAIDNRAFLKMELGLWKEAIDDFKLSLEQNPNSLIAEFSIGECYLNIGDYSTAKYQFEIAHKIDPSHPAPVQFLEKIKLLLSE